MVHFWTFPAVKPYQMAALVTVLVALVRCTEAYTCYSCRYVSTLPSPWANASCTEPFNPNIVGIEHCNGTMCVSTWANFTTEQGYILYRTCQNTTKQVSISGCASLGSNYFVFKDQCCVPTYNVRNPNDTRVYNQMTCFCLGDHCNGQVAYPVVQSKAPGAQGGLLALFAALVCLMWTL